MYLEIRSAVRGPHIVVHIRLQHVELAVSKDLIYGGLHGIHPPHQAVTQLAINALQYIMLNAVLQRKRDAHPVGTAGCEHVMVALTNEVERHAPDGAAVILLDAAYG